MSVIDADHIFGKIDGHTSFAELFDSLAIKYPPDKLRVLFQGLLGTLILLPDAVSQLEQRINHGEIVRFPTQSPYLILRSCWNNAADVRENVPGLFASLDTLQDFRAALSSLHILATIGKDRGSYYGGAGSVPTVPGGYREHAIGTGISAAKSSFIQHQLQDFGLSNPLHMDRFMYSSNGLELGRIVSNGATSVHQHRGDLDSILDELRGSLVTADRALEKNNYKNVISSLAYFHKLFLHAHPFCNINNSIIMNIVNVCLLRAQKRYLPHLLLDFIALRTEPEEYKAIFSDALNRYGLRKESHSDDPATMARVIEYQSELRVEEMKFKSP